jgi:hypothetical protein
MPVTTSAERRFEKELEVFRTECESAAQFFYGYLAIHKVAKDQKRVYKLLNHAPLFWNTILGGLQTSAFIVLGRIFDQNSPHNVDKVLGFAQANVAMFSLVALRRRRLDGQSVPPNWLDEFLQEAYEPTKVDFRSLRKCVTKQRAVYNRVYGELRNKVYAHKIASDPAEVAALFSRTNVGEAKQMLMLLLKLHEVLWELYMNGRKPVLGQVRGGVHKRIGEEAKQFLVDASKVLSVRSS